MMAHKIEGFDDDEIAIIRGKARFLIGSSDRLAYSPESLALLDQYQLSYRIVEQAGHAINHEQPDVIHQEIINHLLG
jgi:pimeloyl-ACP methyl ester carboxylesterase